MTTHIKGEAYFPGSDSLQKFERTLDSQLTRNTAYECFTLSENGKKKATVVDGTGGTNVVTEGRPKFFGGRKFKNQRHAIDEPVEVSAKGGGWIIAEHVK